MARRSKGRDDLQTEVEQLRAELKRVKALLAESEARRTRYLAPDKRRAILALLRQGTLSDRAIARECGVSPTTVGRVRAGRS